jgi:hypothetical protein
MSVIIDGSASVTINNGAVLGITSGTAVSPTSGTSLDFTGYPISWVKRITVMFSGVSMSSFNNWLIQLGSGSVQTSGYVGQGVYFNPATSAVSLSSGFNIANQQAAQFHSGNFVLNLVDTNKWTGSETLFSNANTSAFTSGSVTLSGTLDRVRITTTSGTDTFDAGTINILYEG